MKGKELSLEFSSNFKRTAESSSSEMRYLSKEN